MDIIVHCYAGYRGEETPCRIRMADRSVDVKAILDRWLAPDHRYFKVLGEDEGVYLLRHDTEKWTWELVSYREKES